uniref:Uncharacterized protein n=1 Tax=Panagrolaimus sp. PS1159 TaxID=55785 RepID=A0AC35FBE1_9BILA
MESSQTMQEKKKTLITVLDICDSILPPRKKGNVTKDEKALRKSLLYAIGNHFGLAEDFIERYYNHARDQRYKLAKGAKKDEEKNEEKVGSNEEQLRLTRALQRSTKKLAPAGLPQTKANAPLKSSIPPKSKILPKSAFPPKSTIPKKSAIPQKSRIPPKAQLSDGEKKAKKTAKEDSSEDELDKIDKEAELKAKEDDLQLILAEKSLHVTTWKIFAHFGKVYLENDPLEYSYDPDVSNIQNILEQYSEYQKL